MEETIALILKIASDDTRPEDGLMSKKNAIRSILTEQVSGALNLLLNIQQTSAGPKDKGARLSDLGSRYQISYNHYAEKFT